MNTSSKSWPLALTCLATTALTSLAWSSATAQTTDTSKTAASAPDSGANQGVQEIIVTSQRREENLQKVPLAVTALSGTTLARDEVKSTTDLLRLVPNFTGGEITAAGGANDYALRGLYSSSTAPTFDVPVGTYIDGIFIARLNASSFTLFDVDRIEVLRGPQGTLFGRNTQGGAINVLLEKPSNSFGGYVEAEGGNYDHYQVRGTVNIPISEDIHTRISAFDSSYEGWAKDITTGGTRNPSQGDGVRGALTWNFGAKTTWNLSVDYESGNQTNMPVTKTGDDYVSKSGEVALGSIVSSKLSNIPGDHGGTSGEGVTSDLHTATSLGDLEILTGFRNLNVLWNFDYFDSPNAIGGFDYLENSNHQEFQQEIKLSGQALNNFLYYTAGLFYFHESGSTDFAEVFALSATKPLVEFDRTLNNTVDSYAAYTQVDAHLTQQLTATVGARLTEDAKTIRYTDNNNPLSSFKFTDANLVANGIPLAQTVGVLTPRFALQYQATDDVMLFGSATRGFTSGGWNTMGTAFANLTAFKPQSIWSYETGARSEFFDHKLQVNLTGFYGYSHDLQLVTAVATSNGGAPQYPVGNFSDFLSYGRGARDHLGADQRADDLRQWRL